jgi:hypothetical protein
LGLQDGCSQSIDPKLLGLVLTQDLAALACEDKEEWVNVMGRAVGNFSGELDLQAVRKASATVRTSMGDLEAMLPTEDIAEYRPVEVG